MRKRQTEKVTTRLDKRAADELDAIEAFLKADPNAAAMMRSYDGVTTRGQVVRWAISRAWATLQREAREG